MSKKNVLIIKSSPASDFSVSNEVANYLLENLQQGDDYTIKIRDLNETPAPVYNSDILNSFYGDQENLTEQQIKVAKPSLEYIEELKQADVIVFASPMHNFSVTTLLKSYIDQICRIGHTFYYTEQGSVGMLENKKAIIISSAGGDLSLPVMQAADFQTPYLKHVLNFIGIKNIEVVPVYGVGMGEEVAQAAKDGAKKKLDLLSTTFI